MFFCMLLFQQGFSQKGKVRLVNPALFYLDTTIIQNNSIFKFWRGIPDTVHTDNGQDTMKNKLLIERLTKLKDTILFADYIRDGDYYVGDMNDDGFADFTTFYHDYDEIHFFNPARNNFDAETVDMPNLSAVVDPVRRIYCGYYDAMYGNRYPYSVLYKYKGNTPYFYYQLKFITIGEYGENDSVTHINLVRFKNGNYDDTFFVKEIKTGKPGNFDYEKYWKQNYKKLLGYH